MGLPPTPKWRCRRNSSPASTRARPRCRRKFSPAHRRSRKSRRSSGAGLVVSDARRSGRSPGCRHRCAGQIPKPASAPPHRPAPATPDSGRGRGALDVVDAVLQAEHNGSGARCGAMACAAPSVSGLFTQNSTSRASATPAIRSVAATVMRSWRAEAFEQQAVIVDRRRMCARGRSALRHGRRAPACRRNSSRSHRRPPLQFLTSSSKSIGKLARAAAVLG